MREKDGKTGSKGALVVRVKGEWGKERGSRRWGVERGCGGEE